MPNEPAEANEPVSIARAAFETLVFAPIGLGAMLVEDAPSALRQVRQELRNARFIGRLTVDQGAARLRAAASAEQRPSERVARDADDVVDVGESNESVLAIDGYDDLPAIEIVAQLEALSAAERGIIADHEQANRRRRTVLGKIAQLGQ